MQKVGIIGGSGFIGSYITKVFLDKGFEVKVSATDINREDKYQHLMDFAHVDHLYISELNVENKSALKDFVKNCDMVIHSGTPFKLDVQNPITELFDPTIKGTENFLKAIRKTPSVKKAVFIASVAAFNTNFPMPAYGKTPNDTFNETDTPYFSKESNPYAQAKFIAQRTVEKFIKTYPDLDFEITTVSPVMVMGKSLSKRKDSTSTNLQFLFKNKVAPNPFIKMFYKNDVEFAVVAVQDVAESVFKAATKNELHGKNYLLSSESYKVSDITRMLNGQKPINKPKIVYQNTLAKHDLEVAFLSVKKALYKY